MTDPQVAVHGAIVRLQRCGVAVCKGRVGGAWSEYAVREEWEEEKMVGG
jgi:hypothetical protein